MQDGTAFSGDSPNSMTKRGAPARSSVCSGSSSDVGEAETMIVWCGAEGDTSSSVSTRDVYGGLKDVIVELMGEGYSHKIIGKAR